MDELVGKKAPALSDEEVLRRYRRAMADGQAEHQRVVDEAVEAYSGYALNSIRGKDFADLEKVWGKDPPEIGMMMSNVNTWLGSLIAARKEPIFPGFDLGTADAVIGEMLTILVKACRRWSGSDAVEEQALTDHTLVGYGFVEQYLDTECRPPFRPKERYIPLSNIWWDVGANEKNLADAQWFVRRHHYSVEEAAARFPEHADLIRSLGALGGSDTKAAPGEGARSLGGPAVSVSVSAADGRQHQGSGGGARTRREVAVDDFQETVWEELAAWDGPDGQRIEATVEEFSAAMEAMEQQAAAAGMPFQRPQALIYAQATWYRSRVLPRAGASQAQVLRSAEPIQGNRRLIRCLTGLPEQYLDGEILRTRYWGFKKALLGLQRLASVAVRIYIEQEARRNRAGVDIEKGTFESLAEKEAYVSGRAMPGAALEVPQGSEGKIRERQETVTPHVSSMQQIFKFLAVDLVSHMLGISDLNRGTMTEDRSAKFVTTMLQTSIQMQSRFTTSYTDYLAEGAVTMIRLLLDGFDARDIDRLVGDQPLREGITGQRDEQGQLVPILVLDEVTGEEVPLTTGLYLKKNAGEILDNDVGFGLRPTEATERMAIAGFWAQHGVMQELREMGLAPSIITEAFFKVYGQDSIMAETADRAKAFFQQQEEQQQQAAQAATEEGVVGFMQQLAEADFEKASALMTAISQAVLGPQGGPGPAPPVQ